MSLAIDYLADEGDQKARELPLEDSPAFVEEDRRIRAELARKFAWTAQQGGIVYRLDPLKGAPMQDHVFNRVSRFGHSFHYRDRKGQTKVWFYKMEDVLAVLDDPTLDFGFIMAEALAFSPGQPEISQDELGRKVLNLWRPPPWREVSISRRPEPFLEHLKYLFDADEAVIDHILNFLGHLVQRPQERVNHALLLTSATKGIGKSSFGTIVRRLVGENNSRVAQTKDLKSQFDGWLMGKLVVQVDEIYEHGNWDLANKLKPLITEPTVSVNVKYGPQVEVSNFARFIMFSNHSAPLDIEDGDRRYFIFESKAKARDDAYYQTLHAFIDSTDGMNSIYSYLMQRDLRSFRPFAAPPMTQAKRSIIDVSGNPLRQYIIDAVLSGHLRDEVGPEFSLDQLQRQLSRDGYGQQSKNLKEISAALEAAGAIKARRGASRQRVWVLPSPASTSLSQDNPDF
ncbi:primase-helicase family protein [Bradyrhizobium diazoefficiens]|uniref:primase-helicase family protein n=1 Tax=Bradyrhizobium diazoefficiens TaxID=1355477 RepID=UPI001B400541|nr:hypothetical protein [Bradyrhizobium japonicum]